MIFSAETRSEIANDREKASQTARGQHSAKWWLVALIIITTMLTALGVWCTG